MKEINKYFKVGTDEERKAVEKSIGAELENVSNFSLLQNSLKKNINNNKSSLLFSNFLLKYSNLKTFDIETETLHKLYSMSLKSESPFVRFEVIQNLKKDEVNLGEFSVQLSDLKNNEKSELVLNLLSEF